ncbi:hypothetical protein K1T71_008693 [Dendrolimus kikuchii]|uniref:Uncharacterized protein n=1 Tax=Dendrolimus kikuchii TaxID=765133 RepID=A0ACC1CV35_9NEOP|nr:hypothetical protein K1T71_008693 [Dendrolimus kikuchii]
MTHPAEEINVDFITLEDLSDTTIKDHKMEGLFIFTDGSKTEEKVGAAMTCWKNGREVYCQKFCLASYCTVFQSEMYALYQATKYACNSGVSKINIFSDSRTSLEVLKKPGHTNPLAFATKSNLKIFALKGGEVRIFWKRSHIGVQRNERADLAKQAEKHTTDALDYDKYPIAYLKSTIRQDSAKVWNTRYRDGGTAAITKLFFPDMIQSHRLIRELKLCPLQVQMVTGHGGFAHYLYKFKRKTSPGCICDPEINETIVHLLVECPRYGKARFELEQRIGVRIEKELLSSIIAKKEISHEFIKYGVKIVKDALQRNKSR